MARHAIIFTLLLAACVLEITQAAATKGGKNKNGDNFPEPVRRGKPCDIKSPECVPTYTESDAKKLADLGYFGQVAVVPDMPPGMQRDMAPQDKPKHKRKASCRGEDGTGCRRPQRKRGGEGRKGGGGGGGGAGEGRKGRKGSRKKAPRGEEDPTKAQRPGHDQQTRKERKQRRKQRPTTAAPTHGTTPQ